MQSDRQQRITERAYQIWVAEGRVHGKDHEHWQRAEREIAAEELRVAAALAKRATGAVGTAPAKPRRARQASGTKKPATKTAEPAGAPTAPARRGRRASRGPS